MNKADRIQFARDLNRGAFMRGDMRLHKITLDIHIMTKGNEVCFEEYWSHV